MKKWKKYSLASIGGLLVSCVVVFCVICVCRPGMVRRWIGGSRSVILVYVDHLKGKPYAKGGYDGIDVSRNNGVIEWEGVAKDKRVKFVYVKATEGKGFVDPLYRRNIYRARKVGLKVGAYHFLTSKFSAAAQFQHFKNVVMKEEQDLIPVLDVEENGIRGKWKGKPLQDSVRVFAELVKAYYGKYPIVYSNEHFYNKELAHKFNNYILFIANYRSQPSVDGRGKCNIWQYSERGHLHGIGEYVDLSRLAKGTTVKDLMLH